MTFMKKEIAMESSSPESSPHTIFTNTKVMALIIVALAIVLALIISYWFIDIECKDSCRDNAPDNYAVEYPYHKLALDTTCLCGKVGLYGEEWVRR